jgi:hypothetical protein
VLGSVGASVLCSAVALLLRSVGVFVLGSAQASVLLLVPFKQNRVSDHYL